MAVLGGAFALFAIVLRAIDGTATEIRGSFLPGIVSGLRDWSSTGDPMPARRRSQRP